MLRQKCNPFSKLFYYIFNTVSEPVILGVQHGNSHKKMPLTRHFNITFQYHRRPNHQDHLCRLILLSYHQLIHRHQQ